MAFCLFIFSGGILMFSQILSTKKKSIRRLQDFSWVSQYILQLQPHLYYNCRIAKKLKKLVGLMYPTIEVFSKSIRIFQFYSCGISYKPNCRSCFLYSRDNFFNNNYGSSISITKMEDKKEAPVIDLI